MIVNQDEANALKKLELLTGELDKSIARQDDDNQQYLSDAKMSLFEELEKISERKANLRAQSDDLQSLGKRAKFSPIHVRRLENEDASTLTGATIFAPAPKQVANTPQAQSTAITECSATPGSNTSQWSPFAGQGFSHLMRQPSQEDEIIRLATRNAVAREEFLDAKSVLQDSVNVHQVIHGESDDEGEEDDEFIEGKML
jgi:hypothetical protein